MSRLNRRQLIQTGAAVTAAGALTTAPSIRRAPARAQANLDFWTMNYGDPEPWVDLLRGIASDYGEESGNNVQVEMVNWNNAPQTYLLVTQGGEAPDAADMFWLYSNVQLGGGQYGPQPLTQFKDELWPDLEERFFSESLRDTTWQGEFYGIPWRGDIRPFMYRTDLLEAAGFDRPPDTWEEMVEYGLALTERDSSGNVSRYGLAVAGSGNATQVCMAYYWQAGGSFMNEEGTVATIDNDAMREALTFLHDLVWVHEIVPSDFMEQGHVGIDRFVADQYAMMNGANSELAQNLVSLYPEMDGLWDVAVVPQGPENRATYYGAGYWGALHGASDLEATASWLEFLSRDENMQAVSEFTGNISPNTNVQNSEFWTDQPWKLVYTESLAEHARTSQHPTPVWSALAAPTSGAVLYELFYSAIIRREDIDELLPEANRRMQEEMNRALD